MKEKNYEVGICKFCNQIIKSNQKYVLMYYDRPLPWAEEYQKGLIHEKCRLNALERFNKDLMRDVFVLTKLVKDLNKLKEEKICKKKLLRTHKK